MLKSKELKKVKKVVMNDYSSELAKIFSLLGEPTRYKIFLLLLRYKDLCVTDFAHILNISISAVSHQLKIFELAGLVKKERQGKIICYLLNEDKKIVNLLTKYLITFKHYV